MRFFYNFLESKLVYLIPPLLLPACGPAAAVGAGDDDEESIWSIHPAAGMAEDPA
jgi:hypothetical protein